MLKTFNNPPIGNGGVLWTIFERQCPIKVHLILHRIGKKKKKGIKYYIRVLNLSGYLDADLYPHTYFHMNGMCPFKGKHIQSYGCTATTLSN